MLILTKYNSVHIILLWNRQSIYLLLNTRICYINKCSFQLTSGQHAIKKQTYCRTSRWYIFFTLQLLAYPVILYREAKLYWQATQLYTYKILPPYS